MKIVHQWLAELVDVPADVEARVRRTTPLGEKFVDLVPRTDDLDAPRLHDGATIRRTAVVSDLEQLVSTGTEAFGAISASQLAILLDEGSDAFGGKGPQLDRTLRQLSTIAAGYESRTDQIGSIITDLDQLSGDLAPEVDRNGKVLHELSEVLAILVDDDEELYALVRSLADSGVAVVVVSSEVEEVLGLADRVLVVREGEVVHEAPADELDESKVLDLVMEGRVA